MLFPLGDVRPIAQMRWLEFRNDSSEVVPAFGILRITGSITHRRQTVLKVEQSNTHGSQFLHAVNGPQEVSASRYGLCTLDFPAVARYDDGDGTPAFGEAWGPRNGGWKLRKSTSGFQVVGNPDTDASVVLVTHSPMLSFVGQTDASINKGTSGTISIYAGPLGSESDTTDNMSGVYNRFANVGSGKWVRCQWNHDRQQWELVSAEC